MNIFTQRMLHTAFKPLEKGQSASILNARTLKFEFKQDAIKEYNKLSSNKSLHFLLGSIQYHRSQGWHFDCMEISEEYAKSLFDCQKTKPIKYTRVV